MTALVRGEGDGLGVFLHRGIDDLMHRAVVSQVDHLSTAGLDNAAHHVDGGIMAVEEGSRSYYTDVVFGFVDLWCLHIASDF